MNKLGQIGILLIAIAAIIGVLGYSQQVALNRDFYKLEEKKYELESCTKGGRYLVESTGEGFADVRTVWWEGRWNFEREECEKEEAKYGLRPPKAT